jgi:hypothetical protein
MQKRQKRRQPRVAYAASVRLHPRDRRGSIEGRTVNLSRTGVLVESGQAWEVGTELTCEIPLPGGRRRLRGRVTRQEARSPAAVGLGVQFTGLDRPDEDLLSEVVGNAPREKGSRLVQVRFEGMGDPLRSRATLTEGGVRLSTTLPFLRLRSAVDITFVSGGSKVASRGQLRNVELDRPDEDGVPRLAIDVRLAPDEETDAAAKETPVVALPAALSSLSEIDTSALLSSEPSESFARPVPRIWRARPGMAAGLGVFFLGLGVAALIVWQTPPPKPVPLPVHARASTPLFATTTVAAQKTVVALEPPRPLTPKSAGPPVLVAPAPLPAGTPGPTVDVDGIETTVRVGFQGSTSGMSHHSLTVPRGISVNLPDAHLELPLGRHEIGHDGLRYVWLRERPEGGVQIRFVFSTPPPDQRLLDVSANQVSVRLRAHPPAEPAAVAEPTAPPVEADVDLQPTAL